MTAVMGRRRPHGSSAMRSGNRKNVYVSRFEAPWDNPGLACIDEESKLVFSHVMWEINTWPAVTWSDSLFFNHWELPIHKACTGAIPSHRKEESTSRRPSRRNLMLAGYLY
ncbi:uncharacterized protein LOC123511488 isoform X3 [Portunus trituberculatus]|uniref:uncharacterized protein LOC123511488 isoform X3 n=1 Tax=Portunus trituberculatus TaxID=210409 RepID=UPI001E1CCE6B|nr:uncharacterized protein LOC123511488 isoform X3 [Portunus trituberculatus]